MKISVLNGPDSIFNQLDYDYWSKKLQPLLEKCFMIYPCILLIKRQEYPKKVGDIVIPETARILRSKLSPIGLVLKRSTLANNPTDERANIMFPEIDEGDLVEFFPDNPLPWGGEKYPYLQVISASDVTTVIKQEDAIAFLKEYDANYRKNN